MSDLDTALADHPPAPEAAVTVVSSDRKCNRHAFHDSLWCIRCGKPKDPALSRRGKSADRLGKDQERRIERVYGCRKVGEYGDAVDHIGRDFVWQSKASRSEPRLWLADVHDVQWEPILPKDWLAAMLRMLPLAGHRAPLLIRSYVKRSVGTRDWIFVVADQWRQLHGGDYAAGYLVMTGAHFLEMHGRDE